jgi:hypothetical protein
LKDSWSEAVEKFYDDYEGDRDFESRCDVCEFAVAFAAHVSPSRILELEEERKRLERDDWQEDARRETCNRDYWRDRYHTAMVDLNSTISRAQTAESQLSAALQRIESYKQMSASLKRAVKLLIGRANNIPWNEVDDAEVIAYMAEAEKLKPTNAAALLTEAPQQGGSK